MKTSPVSLLFLLMLAPAAASVPREPLPDETEAVLPAAPGVPTPDLSAMEEAARQKVRVAQKTLEQAMASGDLSPRELADGFGFLGQLYHAYKLLDAAETSYEEARRLAADDPRWAYLVGLVRFAQGQLERSVADFEKALALDPDDAPALVRLGNALIELDRGAEAATYFERALALDENMAVALYGLGKAAAMEGDDERAVELFERTLALQPEASIVHYPLGQAYRRLGDREAALEHLKQRGQDEVGFEDPLGRQVSRLAMSTALEVVLDMADDTEGFSEKDFLGFTLSQFGDVEGTVEQLGEWLARRAAAAADGSVAARARIHYVVGGLLAHRGDDAAAIEHFRRALALAPDLADTRVKLGNALARGGDFEAAIDEYSAVLARDERQVDALLKRAAALMKLERWDEARRDLEVLRVLQPNRIEVRARSGAVLEQLGDLEGAITQYRQALELDLSRSERLRVLTKVAQLEDRTGSLEEAVALYRAVLELDESNVPALSELAGLLVVMNRLPEALPLFARWVALAPDDPRARLAESTALIFDEQYGAASERLEAAIVAFPDVLDFKDILARHLAACPDRQERDGRRAVELAREVFEEVPTPQSAETLAMAYAEAGLFDEAVDWQRRLIEQVGGEAPAGVVSRLEANLAEYESGRPCCAAPGG